MKTVLAAGAAALALGAGVALAPSAQAEPMEICGPGVGVAEGSTSCAFATSVGYAYMANGSYVGSTFIAHSPVTGQDYAMTCSRNNSYVAGMGNVASVRCEGGNNAIVILW